MPIKEIIKRNGKKVTFDQTKITNAIFKAAQAVGGSDYQLAIKLSNEVVRILEKTFKNRTPHVEDVQDIVEIVLIENGHAKTAKAYILYRQRRKEIREAKALLGVTDELKLPLNAVKVLANRNHSPTIPKSSQSHSQSRQKIQTRHQKNRRKILPNDDQPRIHTQLPHLNERRTRTRTT
jgi:anaerobic ribonucleoside-triphosphate reductase